MKFRVMAPTTIDVARVRIECNDPENGPFVAFVDVESGLITHPKGIGPKEVCIKARDSGVYTLIDPQGHQVIELAGEYVPHGLIPGSYGDYIELSIDEQNRITNWPKKPSVDEFLAGKFE